MEVASDNYIDRYLEWLRSNSRQTRIGDFEEITTPFLDSHNDRMQFYISRTTNGYKLTDDGYVMNDLEMCGCDIGSKKRKESIRHIAESLGVVIEGRSIIVEANDNDIARKQHMIVQAMLKIGDMFLTTSSMIKGFFLEEVATFLDENDIRNTPSIMIMGQSGLTHRFDFVIPASKSMPERVLTTLNAPSKQSIQAAMFAWNDSAKTRSARSKGYIVLNDNKKFINPDLLSAVAAYDITPLQWHRRNEYINELAS